MREAHDNVGEAGWGLTRGPQRKPKLLDQLRQAVRTRHYSSRTKQSYCHWVRRFIFFHKVRHPAEMAEPEINAFLTDLPVKQKVSASPQNQALSALLFLYRHVISCEVSDLGELIRARKPNHLPVVMTPEEPMKMKAMRTMRKPYNTLTSDRSKHKPLRIRALCESPDGVLSGSKASKCLYLETI